MKFKKIIIGGSFDLLHIGHKALILEAFKLGEFVNIGVTSDKFNKLRNKQTYESQESRVKSLERFLKEKKLTKRSKIILIDNIFGSSLKDPEIEAIIATRETISNANIVNKERAKLGLKKLEIIILPHSKDKLGKIISSSRIRDGEINQNGKIYKQLLLKIASKKLDKNILNKLKKPLGKIIKIHNKMEGEIITVGDIVTQEVYKLKIPVKLSVIDSKTKRQPVIASPKGVAILINQDSYVASLLRMTSHLIKAINPSSTISKDLILKVEKAIKSKKNGQIILVDGEEDLAAIPAILLSSFGTKVLYGQPDEGVVEVIVNQEIKDKLLGLLDLK